jgi:hypothetical protein
MYNLPRTALFRRRTGPDAAGASPVPKKRAGNPVDLRPPIGTSASFGA